MSAEYAQITTLDEFRAAIGRQDLIVITDFAKDAPTVHHPECGHVNEVHFDQKVIANLGESGQYFSARNTRIAEEHGAVRCGHCYR